MILIKFVENTNWQLSKKKTQFILCNGPYQNTWATQQKCGGVIYRNKVSLQSQKWQQEKVKIACVFIL